MSWALSPHKMCSYVKFVQMTFECITADVVFFIQPDLHHVYLLNPEQKQKLQREDAVPETKVSLE